MRDASWEEFVGTLASVAEVSPNRIAPETRLVADLDLDSLGMIELVVAMLNDFGLAVPDGFDAQSWEALSAGQLFDAVASGELR